MRDLLLLLVVFGSLPLTLFQPFLGLLVYSWLAYMRPHDLVWGSIPQVSLLVALATLGGLVLAGGRERWLSLKLQTVLLVLFGLWFGLSSLMAMDPSLSKEWAISIGKVLLISVITTGLVQDPSRFRYLYLVIAFSLGGLGAKYGLYGLLRGGARFFEGPGGFMTDNNALAMALAMALPLLVGVALVESRRWLKMAAWAFAVCTAAAVIFTFSRGGLIALVVVLAILMARSGRPLVMVAAVAISVPAFFLVTSADFEDAYRDRANSIATYETDASVTGRFREWGTAWEVFSDHPILGVGPDNLRIARPFYALDGSPFKTTHNSFLQLLVACGAPGLMLFIGALVASVWRLELIRRSSSPPWARTYAGMIQVSFAAFVVGGMLLDMAYFDLIYHLMAMTVSLELAATAREAGVTTNRIPALLGTGYPWQSGGKLSPLRGGAVLDVRLSALRVPKVNALSVDVEDYFHVSGFEADVSRSDWDRFEPRVEGNTRRLLSLFQKKGVKSTFFCLGWVAERFPALIQEICEAGHEIACHGYDHRRATSQSPEEFRHDVRRAKRILEDVSGERVVGYRAPSYSIVEDNLWALDILEEEGFAYDSSIFPIVHDRYGIPKSPRFPWRREGRRGREFFEFPISTVRILGMNWPFVGGGYLRHFPFAYIRWGMRRVNQVESQPVVVYVHPWEVDPDQPRLPVGRSVAFRHYRNLHQTEGRLTWLLEHFRFTTLKGVLKLSE